MKLRYVCVFVYEKVIVSFSEKQMFYFKKVRAID